MKPGLIYARVSTEEQAKEGQSIESQLRICQQFAKDNDIDILSTFVDEGKSATNMSRPALQDLLAMVQDKESKVKVVIVQDTDRLARNTLDHLQIKGILRKRAVEVISVSQPIIDDSPEGNLIDTVLAATNAFQSQITGRKTSKVMEQKAISGWFPGGTPPLGYRNADNDKSHSSLDRRIIVLDREIASVMREAFSMYATGRYSVADLAFFLNEKGITSPTGHKVHESLVVRSLANPFYVGRFRWKGKEYQGKHEPLVSQSVFDQVQTVMNSHNKGASRKRKHDFLLRGFLYCSVCDSRYWGEQHEKADRRYSFYFCKKCGAGTYVDTHKIEQQVEEKVAEIEITEEYKEKILELAVQIIEEAHATHDTEKKRLDREKSSLEKALREAEDDRYIRHTITSEDFNRLSDRYSLLLAKVKSQLEKLDTDHSEKLKALERILALAENIGESYKLADPEMKREYLGLFFARFVIKGEKVASFELSPELKDLIEEGSVRVRSNGLPR